MLAALHHNLLDCAPQLRSGDIGVLQTDTIYGLVARADDESAVERVYQIKSRTSTKSPIVLIGSTDQLFDSYSPDVHDYLNRSWPGPYSIILPSTEAPSWITRGNQSVAYRLPDHPELRDLLIKTGPVIAPSANPEDEDPSGSVTEAINYFSDQVDFYVDSGRLEADTSPSELWHYDPESGDSERLR